jgi:hypothetical protein
MENIKEKTKKLKEFITLLDNLENKFDFRTYDNLIASVKKYIFDIFKNNHVFIYLLNEINEPGTLKEVKKVRNIIELIVTSIEHSNLSKYIIENLIPELTNLLRQADLFIESKSINRNKFGIWESDIKDYLKKHNFKPNYYENFLRISQNSNNPLQVKVVIYKRRLLKNILTGLLEEGENLLKINNKTNYKINNSEVIKTIRCPITGSTICTHNIKEKKNQLFLAYNYKNKEIEEIIEKEIIPLIKENSLDPIRAKDEIVNYDFMCKICRQIKESRYLLADISENNLSVGFELGIAVGLQKITMIIANKNSPEIGDLKRTDSIRYSLDNVDKLKSDFANMLKNLIKY